MGNNRSVAYGASYCAVPAAAFASPSTTPRRLLLTFHHLAFDAPMPAAPSSPLSLSPTVLEAIYDAYAAGLETAQVGGGAGATADSSWHASARPARGLVASPCSRGA